MFLKENSPLPSSRLQAISQLIIDTNKKFFFIKNNYQEEIEELQDSLGISVNFIELIEKQHSIIKVCIKKIIYRTLKKLQRNFPMTLPLEN